METVSSNALFHLTHRSKVKNPGGATCDISISDLIDDQTGTAQQEMQQMKPSLQASTTEHSPRNMGI